MLNEIKNTIAHYIIRKKFLSPKNQLLFNDFATKAIDYLVLMPAEDSDFNISLDLIKYFVSHNKNVSLFLPEHKYNLIPQKEKYKFIPYTYKDITKFKLPDKELYARLRSKSFDIAIDLNRNENVFYTAVINSVDCKVRVGFRKKDSDKYYNFQISDGERNSEISYKILLNSLQMF